METQEKFKASKGIGMFVAAIGWIVMGVGVIVALVLFSGHSELKVVTGMLSLIGGIVLGGMTVVQGQMIQCLVAIERNTRKPVVTTERKATKYSEVPAATKPSSTAGQAAAQAYQNGLRLAELNRHEEAIKAYDEAIVSKPDDVDIWFNRGLSLLMLGQLDAAITTFDQCLGIQPDARAFLNRARIHARKGHWSLALCDLSNAIALDPSCKATAIEYADFKGLRNDPDFLKIVGE